jgi:hypothetical protein
MVVDTLQTLAYDFAASGGEAEAPMRFILGFVAGIAFGYGLAMVLSKSGEEMLTDSYHPPHA